MTPDVPSLAILLACFCAGDQLHDRSPHVCRQRRPGLDNAGQIIIHRGLVRVVSGPYCTAFCSALLTLFP
jgi:hypothetical protein